MSLATEMPGCESLCRITTVEGYGRLVSVIAAGADAGSSSSVTKTFEENDSALRPLKMRFEPRSRDAAPIMHVGGESFCCQHTLDCPFQTSLIMFDSLVSPTHSCRSFCRCLSQFSLDKAYALEIQERDLTVDAYEIVQSMARIYGPAAIQKDDDLMEIVFRYEQCAALYAALAEVDSEDSAQLFRNLVRRPDPTPALGCSLDVSTSTPQRQLVVASSSLSTLSSSYTPSTPLSLLRITNPSTPEQPMTQLGPQTMLRTSEYRKSDQSPVAVQRSQSPIHRLPSPSSTDAFTLPSVERPFPLASPSDHSHWKMIVDDGQDIRVWYKMIPKTTGLLFRLDGKVATSLLNVISVMAQVEYTRKWVPSISFPVRMGLVHVDCLERNGRFDKVSIYDFAMPWPFKNRHACVHGWLVDDLERNNTLAFNYRSLDEKSPAPYCPVLVVPPAPPNSIRVQFDGGATITPIDNNQNCFVRMGQSVRHHTFRHFMKLAFNAFRKQCMEVKRNPKSEFFLAQQQDQWLYGFLQQRLHDLARFRQESTVVHQVGV